MCECRRAKNVVLQSVLSSFEVAPPAFEMKTCHFDSGHKKDGPLIFKSRSCCFPFEVHSDESNVLGSSCEVNIISKSVPFAVMPRGLCPSTSPPPPPPPHLKRQYNLPESCGPLFLSGSLRGGACAPVGRVGPVCTVTRGLVPCLKLRVGGANSGYLGLRQNLECCGIEERVGPVVSLAEGRGKFK